MSSHHSLLTTMLTSEAKHPWAAALGRIPSGLFILTANWDGLETGMLASWIQQCSFEPPQVTVALQRGRYFGESVNPGKIFTINVLDDAQTDMIGHFGRGFEPGIPAFEGIDVQRRNDAGPILPEALAYLDCQVAAKFPAGDHDLVVCRVLSGGLLNEGRPMVHVRKSGTHY